MNSYTKSKVETTTWEQEIGQNVNRNGGFPNYELMEEYWNQLPNLVSTTNVVPISQLVEELRDLDIKGRTIMVHSSYKAIRPVEKGPQGVVDAFVEAVGERGTLLFPTYDFHSFSEQGYWDRNNSPSQMGVISETARRDRRFERTSHPLLSYAVYRKKWEDHEIYFEDVPVSHGLGSIFEALVNDNGLLISFSGDGFKKTDVGYTISNHCAVLAGAPWRYTKIFRGVVVSHGVAQVREYSASVNKDPDKYETTVTAAHDEAERLGIIKRMPLGNTQMLVAAAREFVSWGIESHKTNSDLWRTPRAK